MKKPKPPDLGKYTAEEIVIIQELEEAAKHYRPKAKWTPFQVEQLKRFYGKVPGSQLTAKLGHGDKSIADKAHSLGLSKGNELRKTD